MVPYDQIHLVVQVQVCLFAGAFQGVQVACNLLSEDVLDGHVRLYQNGIFHIPGDHPVLSEVGLVDKVRVSVNRRGGVHLGEVSRLLAVHDVDVCHVQRVPQFEVPQAVMVPAVIPHVQVCAGKNYHYDHGDDADGQHVFAFYGVYTFVCL